MLQVLPTANTVKAVVRGTEQAASKEATAVWNQNYLEITPDHGSLTSTYIPNDACMADVDGDGEPGDTDEVRQCQLGRQVLSEGRLQW